MPTITYYRQWCKQCNEFELHRYINEELICKKCSTVYTDVYLSDIPTEKLTEQRKRYTESKFGFLNNSFMDTTFKPVGSNMRIVESDAGQDIIDEQNKQKWDNAVKRIDEQKQLQNKYKNLGRNDKCFCGSNLKFKKCCYSKIYI